MNKKRIVKSEKSRSESVRRGNREIFKKLWFYNPHFKKEFVETAHKSNPDTDELLIIEIVESALFDSKLHWQDKFSSTTKEFAQNMYDKEQMMYGRPVSGISYEIAAKELCNKYGLSFEWIVCFAGFFGYLHLSFPITTVAVEANFTHYTLQVSPVATEDDILNELSRFKKYTNNLSIKEPYKNFRHLSKLDLDETLNREFYTTSAGEMYLDSATKYTQEVLWREKNPNNPAVSTEIVTRIKKGATKADQIKFAKKWNRGAMYNNVMRLKIPSKLPDRKKVKILSDLPVLDKKLELYRKKAKDSSRKRTSRIRTT